MNHQYKTSNPIDFNYQPVSEFSNLKGDYMNSMNFPMISQKNSSPSKDYSPIDNFQIGSFKYEKSPSKKGQNDQMVNLEQNKSRNNVGFEEKNKTPTHQMQFDDNNVNLIAKSLKDTEIIKKLKEDLG